jgi:uncharacterized protein (TIGR00251 family)
MIVTENKDGVIIEIYVKPNSSKFEVYLEGEEIVVRSTEEPQKGKVNKEIVKQFSKLFRTEIEIVSGSTSRKKLLLIKKTKKQDVENFLVKENSKHQLRD